MRAIQGIPWSAGRSEIRIIFAFDPTRSALLLLGGDKAGNWERWYRENIPVAERLYGTTQRRRRASDAEEDAAGLGRPGAAAVRSRRGPGRGGGRGAAPARRGSRATACRSSQELRPGAT
ncbi:type II toxin-antitoxin system RelE/ParE family toxin [Streptomyces anulatus]|uniref:type II toxin-antitoxin system RelE/ParE family toxin n=1 Tax=Streptomyces anulatus TaxID=1892 RepID=UPI00224CF663|nr:type II toxin-antitoxin system RelE/ParE family toxin [Streptomyces anulatus]MCX4503466.1 type II toxin-antitoxin system RelE/ParE family toxin [Streptomyces anulatus]